MIVLAAAVFETPSSATIATPGGPLCEAYRAVDAALVADGEAAGPEQRCYG